MAKKYFYLLFLISSLALHSQTPTINWSKIHGGTFLDQPFDLIKTADGNYVSFGYRQLGEQFYNSDTYSWLVKLDPNGNMLWQKNYGETNTDVVGYTVKETSDGGLILLGSVYKSNTGYDARLVKTDGLGNIVWSKTFAGLYSGTETFKGIVETPDGYMLAGYSESESGTFNVNFGGNLGGSDGWVLKLDPTGNILWKKNYGTVNSEYFNNIVLLSNGDSIVSGYSYAQGGNGLSDFWIVRIDKNGVVLWDKKYGGNGYDESVKTIITYDGNLICVGKTRSSSYSGNVAYNHGNDDAWVVKLSSETGNLLWENTFGGTEYEHVAEVKETNDHSLVLAGDTSSNDNGISIHGASDSWIFKISETGNLIWQKAFGGSVGDTARGFVIDNDNEYVIANSSSSYDHDVNNPSNTNFNLWLFKLSPDTSGNLSTIDWNMPIAGNNCDFVKLYPNPSPRNEFFTNYKITESKTIEVFDATGKLVHKNTGFKNYINLDFLQKGIYTAQVIEGDSPICVKKIIIE
ncbi:T9SS type A sorting domain-containing protein [Flavobacterium humi]|uniref:T9SS type A sorting domain-containing protein n=1 Tax=Flavobacterium humi TaxID=2562683 RepID=A0A4Z0L5U1_9FLAO|nr:T9SS type A sorting domain-containing protein [Flavobacterium humi]TGD57628.1 T9SS type A sorting domain-containing protein [Flavobacterium humi]